jgi:hypothetical protein
VNARIEDVNAALGTVTDTFSIICECGDAACTDQITIDVGDYERLRRDPTRFVLVGGHEDPAVETIVEDHSNYAVVRKHEGEPAALARETRPT